MSWRACIIVVLLTVAALPVHAETKRMLDAQRITLQDLVPEATGSVATLDLGAAPPPGSSRLFSRDDVRTAILLAQETADGLPIPPSVRVVRVTQKLSERELESLIRPSVAALLPQGATIVSMRLPNSVLAVPHVTVGNVRMPRLPKRVGLARATAVAELTVGGEVLSRVPVALDIQVDERATRYMLERGSPLNLVIDTGLTRITAAAVTQTPADIGDIVTCQVSKTRKILRAKLVSSREAVVVQQ